MERSLNFASNEPLTTPDIKFKSTYARNLILAYYAQKRKFGPRLPKMEFFKKNSFFFWKCLQISLPTSPQPPPDIKFKSSYARKRDFGLLCPNMEVWPQAPKNGIFREILIFLKRPSDLVVYIPPLRHILKISEAKMGGLGCQYWQNFK